jgi:hypothetical protein
MPALPRIMFAHRTGPGSNRPMILAWRNPTVRLLAAEDPGANSDCVTLADWTSRVWAGIRVGPTELITAGRGKGIPMRTDGAHQWGAISLPGRYLAYCRRAPNGCSRTLPEGVSIWHPAMSGDDNVTIERCKERTRQ